MRNKTKENFYLFYKLENNDFKFLYKVRDCKIPEKTKEYKKLQGWLDRSIIKSFGYCNQHYFNTEKIQFIDPNLTYLKIN